MQERAIEEVKLAIKPFYQKRDITKDEYKEILRKAVQKVCNLYEWVLISVAGLWIVCSSKTHDFVLSNFAFLSDGIRCVTVRVVKLIRWR